MPGTRTTTSDRLLFGPWLEPSPRASGLLMVPDGFGLSRPRTDRKKPRIGLVSPRAGWHNLSFQSLLLHRLKHHTRRDPRRVVSDVEKITFQIDVQRSDTWKP
jgi:hypothetical protein